MPRVKRFEAIPSVEIKVLTGKRGRPKTVHVELDSKKRRHHDNESLENLASKSQGEETGGSGSGGSDCDYEEGLDIDSGDKPQSSHTARQEKAETAWDKLRKKLLESRLEMLAPFAVVCSFCEADLQEGSFVRCSDCGPCVFYCLTCDSKIHSVLQFHKQYVWTEGKTYLPVKRVPRLCQQSLHQCECDAVQTSNIVLFDCEGMSSDAVIEHCQCHREQLAVTLLRHGFWPASPVSPKVAFSLQLMELCTCLQLHGSISVQAIAMSLKEMDPLLGLRPQASSVPDLYRNLLGAINEYRFHRSQISRTGALSKASIHSCPVCSMNPSGAVTSLDGNFGLVHKRRTGGLEKARHQNVFFFKDENVQQFVQDWAADRRNIATNCSQFQAGDTLRSKNKTAGLDVTGVFGSVCQHEFPGVMVNLKHGERLSYPVFILQDLLSRTKNISAPQKQLVMYDVACMLQKHLEVRKSQLLQHFTFSVPAFHRFAHNMACQLSFGQRCTVGAGLHDGEGMERVWAYLRGFASVSKQMTLANREDLLTDALLAYSRRSFGQLRKKLVGQMETADRIEREAQADLEPLERQLVREAGGDSKTWLGSWKAEVATQTNNKGTDKLFPKEEYCFSIVQLSEKRSAFTSSSVIQRKESLAMEMRQLEITAAKLQNKLKISSPWSAERDDVRAIAAEAKKKFVSSTVSSALGLAKERQFLYHLLAKYTNGQAVAARIGKQLQKNSQQINKAANTLTSLGLMVSPDQLSDLDSELYTDCSTSPICAVMKKAALRRADLDRACEAKVQVKKDMRLFLEYLQERQSKLDEEIQKDVKSLQEIGQRHLLCVRKMYLEGIFQQCLSEFSLHLDCMPEYIPSELGLLLSQRDIRLDLVSVPTEERYDSDDEI